MIGMYLFLKNNFKYQFNVDAGSERNELKLHSILAFECSGFPNILGKPEALAILVRFVEAVQIWSMLGRF